MIKCYGYALSFLRNFLKKGEMKLDPTFLRYMTKDEFRVLTAVELGQKNHEMVPIPLITSISNLRHGGASKLLSNLLRHKLLHHETKSFDGYRLTNLGYDYLSLKSLINRGQISGLGRQIGVGKESDIFVVINEKKDGEQIDLDEQEFESEELCMKLHRLGRTSFRSIKNNRDYHKGRSSPSWLYLSRLAAQKEFEFMKVLHANGFPVPTPVDQNRHAVIMSIVHGYTLNTVRVVRDVEALYSVLMELIERFAKYGLIHGDFNEFNLMVDEEANVTVIDFPQMVSIDHRNAKMYFERDVNCIRRFFRKRFDYVSEEWPLFKDVAGAREKSLDVDVQASGFLRYGVKESVANNDLSKIFEEKMNVNVDSEASSEEETSNENEQTEDNEKARGDDGPLTYKDNEGELDETQRKKEKSRSKQKAQDNMDDLRKIVRSEMKRSNTKKGRSKAMKVSRNQVKAKSKRNARSLMLN